MEPMLRSLPTGESDCSPARYAACSLTAQAAAAVVLVAAVLAGLDVVAVLAGVLALANGVAMIAVLRR